MFRTKIMAVALLCPLPMASTSPALAESLDNGSDYWSAPNFCPGWVFVRRNAPR